MNPENNLNNQVESEIQALKTEVSANVEEVLELVENKDPKKFSDETKKILIKIGLAFSHVSATLGTFALAPAAAFGYLPAQMENGPMPEEYKAIARTVLVIAAAALSLGVTAGAKLEQLVDDNPNLEIFGRSR